MKTLWRKISLVFTVVLFIVPTLISSTKIVHAELPACATAKQMQATWDKANASWKKANPYFLGDLQAEQATCDASSQVQAQVQANTQATGIGLSDKPVSNSGGSLMNPLNATSITEMIGRIIKFLLGFAGSIALLMFVWGGFQFLTSAGDSGKVKKGKDTLIQAALGIAIMIAAFAIVNAVIAALTSGTAA